VSLSSIQNEFEVCGGYMNCSLSCWRRAICVFSLGMAVRAGRIPYQMLLRSELQLCGSPCIRLVYFWVF